MEFARKLISIVDDDQSVRETLPDLLWELGYAARAFASAQQFLVSDRVRRTRCLIPDTAMLGMSVPELQLKLTPRRVKIPIAFITAQADEPARTRRLKRGAPECLFEPFSEPDLP
jgi:FixJ family two-component response regulator